MGNLLIYGGTFDPPHKGHRHLLQIGLKQAEFDHVFLIPAYLPPHKEHHPTLSFEKRTGILQDWFGDISGLEILDIEQRRGGKSFTVDTVSEIQRLYPADTIHLLIGTDMFLSFEKWYRFKDILKNVILVVGSREVGDRQKLEECRGKLIEKYDCKGIILCNMKPIVCASSDLRSTGDGLAQRVLAYINETMDVDRARHTMLVADYARHLAQIHDLDPEKAYLAGLLHDCTKCYPKDWQLRFAKEHQIHLSEHDIACPQVLHQQTVSTFVREKFGVDDEELLSAIGSHTTGKVGMSLFDMLIYFADGCEPSRNYSGVDLLRTAGENNLMEGTLLLLEHSIQYLNCKKARVHPQTLEARDAIKELQKNG